MTSCLRCQAIVSAEVFAVVDRQLDAVPLGDCREIDVPGEKLDSGTNWPKGDGDQQQVNGTGHGCRRKTNDFRCFSADDRSAPRNARGRTSRSNTDRRLDDRRRLGVPKIVSPSWQHAETRGMRQKHGGHRSTENSWPNRVAPVLSSARATFSQLTRLPSGKMVRMKSTNRTRIVAWVCLLGGFLIVAWQAASGGGSDKLFNIGLVAMITGSVLRVFGKHSRSNRWADVPRKPLEEPIQTDPLNLNRMAGGDHWVPVHPELLSLVIAPWPAR
jgi:hypothetical protein